MATTVYERELGRAAAALFYALAPSNEPNSIMPYQVNSDAVAYMVRHMRGTAFDRGGGALPSNGLLGMCRWMGSHFHDSTDNKGVAFSSIFNRVTRMG